jgi:hypothetical protein
MNSVKQSTVYQLSAEDKQYWSAENFFDRIEANTIDDLTNENDRLKKKVSILSAELEAAKRRICELTGEPDTVAIENADITDYPKRSYCDWQFPEQEEDEEEDKLSGLLDDQEEKLSKLLDEISGLSDDISIGCCEIQRQYCCSKPPSMDIEEEIEQKGKLATASFFGELPNNGEAIENEEERENEEINSNNFWTEKDNENDISIVHKYR